MNNYINQDFNPGCLGVDSMQAKNCAANFNTEASNKTENCLTRMDQSQSNLHSDRREYLNLITSGQHFNKRKEIVGKISSPSKQSQNQVGMLKYHNSSVVGFV